MNDGIQDAHNLAWKLAAALRGGDAERLLDSYDIERRAVVVEGISRSTDVVTRLFLQTPALVRTALFVMARGMSRIAWARRRNLRRAVMIDLDYPVSPLLPARRRSAGVRLPNVRLSSEDGSRVRLYDLLPCGPFIIACGDDASVASGLPVGDAIRLGAGAYVDVSGRLQALLGRSTGWILVRPDAHIAGVTSSRAELSTFITSATGM
jgi:pimeloyl-ACP methyl ester carboxylesterase